MESILIITPVICKVIEIIGTISGGLVAAILKKIKEKFYDNHGCNSGCIIKFETFCNKTSQLVRDLSTKHL